MEKNIVKTILIPASREEVWESLTNSEDISTWLMQTIDFNATTGERFTMQAKPMGKWDGKIYGEILSVQKPSLLSYTWKGDQMKSNTVIEWRLEAKGDDTLLTLHHRGFSGFSDYILGVFHSMGWGRFMKQLKELVIKR